MAPKVPGSNPAQGEIYMFVKKKSKFINSQRNMILITQSQKWIVLIQIAGCRVAMPLTIYGQHQDMEWHGEKNKTDAGADAGADAGWHW